MEEIQHVEHGNSGTFFIKEGGSKAAQLDYRKSDKNEMVIDHTYVSPVLKGKGAGKALVYRAVEWAREHKMKVTPRCSFAKAVIEKDESLQDVLF
jgi:predicted GNAT family acetyltransferase